MGEYNMGLSQGDRNVEVTLVVRCPYGEVPLYMAIHYMAIQIHGNAI